MWKRIRRGRSSLAKYWSNLLFSIHGEYHCASFELPTNSLTGAAHRYLVVTSDELLELKVHDEKRYLVAVERVHSLGNIVKITFKKRTPKLLTFIFASEGVDVPSAAQTTASQRSSEVYSPPSSSQETAVPTDALPTDQIEEPKQQQSEPTVITTRFIVERPNECIATVTRAAEAFFQRQDRP